MCPGTLRKLWFWNNLTITHCHKSNHEGIKARAADPHVFKFVQCEGKLRKVQVDLFYCMNFLFPFPLFWVESSCKIARQFTSAINNLWIMNLFFAVSLCSSIFYLNHYDKAVSWSVASLYLQQELILSFTFKLDFRVTLLDTLEEWKPSTRLLTFICQQLSETKWKLNTTVRNTPNFSQANLVFFNFPLG